MLRGIHVSSAFTRSVLGLFVALASMTANAQPASEPDAFTACAESCTGQYTATVFASDLRNKYNGRKGYLCGCASSYDQVASKCLERHPEIVVGKYTDVPVKDIKLCRPGSDYNSMNIPLKAERYACQKACGAASVRLVTASESKEAICGCNDTALSCYRLTLASENNFQASPINDPHLDSTSCKVITSKKPDDIAKLDADIEKLKKPDGNLDHKFLVAQKRKLQAEQAVNNLKPGEDPAKAQSELASAKLEVDAYGKKFEAREKNLEKLEAQKRSEIAKQYNEVADKSDSGSLAKKAALKDAITADKGPGGLNDMLTSSGGKKFDEKSLADLEKKYKDAHAEHDLALRNADKAMTESTASGNPGSSGTAAKTATSGSGEVAEGQNAPGQFGGSGSFNPFDKDHDHVLSKSEQANQEEAARAAAAAKAAKNSEGSGEEEPAADTDPSASQSGSTVAAGNAKNGNPTGATSTHESVIVNDPCRGTILNEMADEMKHDKKFAASDRRKKDMDDWIEANHGKVNSIKAKYGCKDDLDSIGFWDNMNNFVQGGVAVAGGVAGGMAAGNVQREFQEKQGDSAAVNRKAFEEMGSALQTTAYVQIGAGIAQMVLSNHGRRVENRQDEAQDRVTMIRENRVGVVDDQGHQLKNKGMAAYLASDEDKFDAQELNKEGNQMTEAAIAAHERTAKAAKEFKVKTFMQSLVNLATGASNWSQGKQYKDTANMFSDPAAQNPTGELAPGESGGDVENTPPPPIVGGGGNTDSGELAQTAVTDPEEKRKAGAFPGGPLIGGRTSGGLKDGQKFGGNGGGGSFGPMGTVAGGGNGVGGGVNAASSGSGGGDKPAGADNVVGGGAVKFEGGGAASGAPAFGSGSGGTGSAGKGGGSDMDINGLLAQLMPKPGEEHGAGGPNILGPGRGLASGEGGEGGVLGRNANLFLRISGTTMNYYKKGELR